MTEIIDNNNVMGKFLTNLILIRLWKMVINYHNAHAQRKKCISIVDIR